MKKLISISFLTLLLVACSSPTNEATKVQSTTGEEKENGQKDSEPSVEVNEEETTTPKQEELPKQEEQRNAILSTEEQTKRLKEARQTAEQAYAALETSSSGLFKYREVQFEHSTKVDTQLNDIYKILEQQLPEADFQALQQQQRQWLEEREAYANKVAEPSAGTRGAGDLYNEGILEYTEQRIEEWIQIYGD